LMMMMKMRQVCGLQILRHHINITNLQRNKQRYKQNISAKINKNLPRNRSANNKQSLR
jgi:hypothetical protein